MKEHPILFSDPMVRAILTRAKTQTRRILRPKNGQYIPPSQVKDQNGWMQLLRECPYGRPGDRIWVREAFWQPRDKSETLFRADGAVIGCGKWKPSIHMPRSVSRILLEITAVRVERLQDIEPSDCVEEGYASPPSEPYQSEELASLDWYRHLWESINGPKSWEDNPWVWVIEFKRVEMK